MPLPADPKAAWPPKALAPAYATMAEHAAWWSGDTARLTAAYSTMSQGQASQQAASEGRWRFWRQQAGAPATRVRLHIPLAADIATTSSDLLFAEPPELAVDDKGTQRRLDELVELVGLRSLLREAGEVAAALSGVYLRVTWDRTLADHALLGVVHPDSAVPEIRWGQLVAVTFWRPVDADSGDHAERGAVYRLLERHEPGKILYGLYQGDERSLGHRVPLTDLTETAQLAATLDLVDGDTVATGATGLTSVYIRNMGPSRRHRASQLGRSDYEGIEPVMDALDETWTSWMRDLRLARARLIVPREYLRSLGKGQGAAFDVDQEVFVPLDGMEPGDSSSGITAEQFEIRHEAHHSTATALVERAVATAGYSARSFGLHGEGGSATATEIHSSDRKSFITRTKKLDHITPGLQGILLALLEADRAQFSSSITPERPRIVWPDGVEEQPLVAAQTIDALHRAQAVSTETKVRMLHPDWGDVAVGEETARILAEAGQAVDDPMQAGLLP